MKEVLVDEIEIVSYNPLWPSLFDEEAVRLRMALGSSQVVAIEHFGSTAVPGLAAKPIIDILVGVRSLPQARMEAVPALELLGYAFWGDNPDPDHLFFVKGLPPCGPRTHHIHIFESDAPEGYIEIQDRLLFRDFLRTHPKEVSRYQTLKYDLASRFRSDREAYTEAKTEYMRVVMVKARQQENTELRD